MDTDTLNTYNRSSSQLADYFAGIRPRKKYVDYALSFLGKPSSGLRVLEIGCGDGRDAKYISSIVGKYTGIDYSEGMIRLAKKDLVGCDLRVADMLKYEYSHACFDAVFAFASILHLDIEANRVLFSKVADSLKPGGIFYVSTKRRDVYVAEYSEDSYGKRLFYYYSEDDIRDIAGCANLEIVEMHVEKIGAQDWLEITLRKQKQRS